MQCADYYLCDKCEKTIKIWCPKHVLSQSQLDFNQQRVDYYIFVFKFATTIRLPFLNVRNYYKRTSGNSISKNVKLVKKSNYVL